VRSSLLQLTVTRDPWSTATRGGCKPAVGVADRRYRPCITSAYSKMVSAHSEMSISRKPCETSHVAVGTLSVILCAPRLQCGAVLSKMEASHMPHPLAKLEAPPAVDVAIGGLVSSGSPCAVFIFFFSLLSSSDSSSTMSAWSSRRTWIVGCSSVLPLR